MKPSLCWFHKHVPNLALRLRNVLKRMRLFLSPVSWIYQAPYFFDIRPKYSAEPVLYIRTCMFKRVELSGDISKKPSYCYVMLSVLGSCQNNYSWGTAEFMDHADLEILVLLSAGHQHLRVSLMNLD
jgi:hypothetical protein